MKQLLEQGYGFIIPGFFAVIGLLTRLVLWREYALLRRECRNFGITRNKIIASMHDDLCKRAQNSVGIKSAAVYTECRLLESKVFGIRLGIWEGVMEQSVLLVMLCGALEALAGILCGCEAGTILSLLFLGSSGGFLLLVIDFTVGLREKRKRVRLHIRDYIENSWTYETEEKEGLSSVRQEIQKAKGRKPCKAQEEKRRLTEELLRERRQLEARHIAELRDREKEEVIRPENTADEKPAAERTTAYNGAAEYVAAGDIPVESRETETQSVSAQQAQTEAAATEISYESLLREVLSEYLA